MQEVQGDCWVAVWRVPGEFLFFFLDVCLYCASWEDGFWDAVLFVYWVGCDFFGNELLLSCLSRCVRVVEFIIVAGALVFV